MKPSEDNQIREQLVKHLKGGEAFMTIDAALEKITYEDVAITPPGLPYSFYQLFFHIRLAQYDIIEFSRNQDYQSPEWPKEYWPRETGPENKRKWEELKEMYFSERKEFCEFILDSENDLFRPFAHGSGQNLLREALLVVEHTAYHTGQLLIVLRLLGKL
jgi:uncharacterized damage-inducible protein DinB